MEYYESFLSTIGLQHSVSILKEKKESVLRFLFFIKDGNKTQLLSSAHE